MCELVCEPDLGYCLRLDAAALMNVSVVADQDQLPLFFCDKHDTRIESPIPGIVDAAESHLDVDASESDPDVPIPL